MWERAQKQQATRVVNDQFGRPTYTIDLARATWELVERHTGHRTPDTEHRLFHIANTGIASWYDIAKHIFHAAGADQCLDPCASVEFPRLARRPAWSVLDTTRYEALVGRPLPRWEDAVGRFLNDLTPISPS